MSTMFVSCVDGILPSGDFNANCFLRINQPLSSDQIPMIVGATPMKSLAISKNSHRSHGPLK